MERRGENWHWAERAGQLPCRWDRLRCTPPPAPGNSCSCSASGLSEVSPHLGVALGRGSLWPKQSLEGANIGGWGCCCFQQLGSTFPLRKSPASGPALCVHHMPWSSSALQDLVKHSVRMHTMEFCAIVMKKDTTDECLMTENMCTHLFNKYLLKTYDIPNTLLKY